MVMTIQHNATESLGPWLHPPRIEGGCEFVGSSGVFVGVEEGETGWGL